MFMIWLVSIFQIEKLFFLFYATDLGGFLLSPLIALAHNVILFKLFVTFHCQFFQGTFTVAWITSAILWSRTICMASLWNVLSLLCLKFCGLSVFFKCFFKIMLLSEARSSCRRHLFSNQSSLPLSYQELRNLTNTFKRWQSFISFPSKRIFSF